MLVLADSLVVNKQDTGKKLCSFALGLFCSSVEAHSYTPDGERSGIPALALWYRLALEHSYILA